MNSLQSILRSLAAVQDVIDRSTFTSAGRVELGDWNDLDGATAWCASRWRTFQHRYRRSVAAQAYCATFEFEDALDAVYFSLRYG